MPGLLVLGLVVVLVVLGPLASVWALNTLFGLGIGYSFKTWAAALLLGIALRGSSS